ncbi:type I restriction modification DNA specificity domain protein [Corynebacterium simulans]|uniref:restriction endonuclease subunit S n=1 Tax=Corynebacterium simulans TaxID=146827 RepID=UPI00078B624D|nr:restriction endonuclease subunit S [Corynebacterium simulans]AMO91963.1 type I restriction modification DNA specificity domain protein [Corynebacterium simulans]
MHSNWRTTTLGETLPFSYGKNLPAKTRSHTGEFDVVTSAGVVDSHNEAYVHVPSIVIGRKGTIGSLTYCPNPVWPTDTTFFATETDACDLRFGYYLLHTLHLRELNNDSAVPGLNRSDAHALEIHLPPLSEQVGIAKVLGALDDKISTNVRIINATDSLVDVLYSRVIKTPTEQSFAEVAQVFGGSTPSTKNDAFWDGDINWATPTDITALDGPWIGDTSRKITKAGLASMSSSLHPENSILMTSRATIGAIALASGPIATNQGFIVVEAPDELTPWLFAQMKARKHEFEAWANGATFMELSRGNFKKLPFIGCSDDDLQAFNDAAWPLLKRAQAAQKENQVLARTRDELLPLLMSGRITVGEAEEAADVAGTAASES